MNWSDARLAIIDTETTGLQPARDRVFDLAVVGLECGRVELLHQQLVHPGCPLPAEIIALTRFTDQDLAGARAWSAEPFDRLAACTATRLLAAYNAPFDHAFLAAEAVRQNLLVPCLGDANDWIDPLVLARILTRGGRFDRGYRLVEIAERLHVHAEGHAHRAAADALMASRALDRMLAWLPATVDDTLILQQGWRDLQDAQYGREGERDRNGRRPPAADRPPPTAPAGGCCRRATRRSSAARPRRRRSRGGMRRGSCGITRCPCGGTS